MAPIKTTWVIIILACKWEDSTIMAKIK